jgi:subtilisin family serine protease
MNKTTLSRNLIVALLLFASVCFYFTKAPKIIPTNSVMTQRLMQEVKEHSCNPQYVASVMLYYPQNTNLDTVDKSFFTSRNIEYFKTPFIFKDCSPWIAAKIPICLIGDIGTIRGLKYADIDPVAKTMEVTSQGRDATCATKFVLNGIDGKGVKIAIIDAGFKNYDKLQKREELPRGLHTKDFTSLSQPEINPSMETELHGSACAEIIYDIAPKAEMYLLKVKVTSEFYKAYDYCISEGINIISCSLQFIPGDCFADGSGAMAACVDKGTDNNILSVVSAGNHKLTSWLGRYQDCQHPQRFTRFPSGKDYLDVNIPEDSKIYLTWNDFPHSYTAYNIHLYDRNEVFIKSSDYIARGMLPSVEIQSPGDKSELRLRIAKTDNCSSLSPMEIRLMFEDKSSYLEDFIIDDANRNYESSLSNPGDSRTALTVGAITCSNYNLGKIAPYSSRGPTRACLAKGLPELIKPDIVAPTGVTTVSLGDEGFHGTSAAVPHVAGAAALLLSLDRSLSSRQLKEKVVSYARQAQSSPDNIYGYGKLVLNPSNIVSSVGDFVCYPNPASISDKGYIKITNLPFNTSKINITVYTITGGTVRSFDASDLVEDMSINKRMIKWNLKNQDGKPVAPGVYFVVIKTPVADQQVKKIAIQK